MFTRKDETHVSLLNKELSKIGSIIIYNDMSQSFVLVDLFSHETILNFKYYSALFHSPLSRLTRIIENVRNNK